MVGDNSIPDEAVVVEVIVVLLVGVASTEVVSAILDTMTMIVANVRRAVVVVVVVVLSSLSLFRCIMCSQAGTQWIKDSLTMGPMIPTIKRVNMTNT